MTDTLKEEYVPIDIKTLANRYSPSLGKLIPKFLYRYLEKILHVSEINSFLNEHYNDDSQTFLDSVVSFLDIHISLEGRGEQALEELSDQSVLFASNHPYGGPEAMVLFDVIHRFFPNSVLLAQGFLKFIKPLQNCCVYNKKEVKTLKNAIEDGKSLLFYPAGYCSRMLSFKEVFDYEWKDSFVKIAKKEKMPILTFYTDGQLSKRMHRWTSFRNFFHIKTSIETLFLVDEMFLMRGKTLRIVVGDTIYPQTLSDNVNTKEWAARIRQYCYGLRKNPDLIFESSKQAVLPLV